MSKTFSQLYSSIYDVIYAGKDYDREASIIEAALERLSTGPTTTLLDVGCGTGEHSRRLADAGLHVVGVDRSPHMLECARDKTHGENPAYALGDARGFDLSKRFDAAIMMFAVLSYQTTNDDLVAALSSVRRHLRPGGLFLFDAWYGPAVLAHPPGGKLLELDTPNGKILRATTTALSVPDHKAGIHFKVWRLGNDRSFEEAEELHEMRFFFPQELSYFLKQAGFNLVHLGAFPEWERPPGSDDWSFFAAAEAQ